MCLLVVGRRGRGGREGGRGYEGEKGRREGKGGRGEVLGFWRGWVVPFCFGGG